MKLLRYGEIGREKPGILDRNGAIRDLSGVVADFAGAALGRESLARIKALDLATLPLVQGEPRIGAPVGVVPKFLGIGLNYRDHAEETGMPIPEVADRVRQGKLLRLGSQRSGAAPPKGFERMDFEVELAVVIGTRAKNVSEADALDYVAGYAICNDMSERSLQKGGARRMDQGQELRHFRAARTLARHHRRDPRPAKARSRRSTSTAPRMQTGSTSTMIFSVAALVELYQHNT